MKTRLLSVSLAVILMLSAAVLFAGAGEALPTDQLVQREFTPNYNKPGGIVIGGAMPRAFHYGGRHAVRDQLNRIHVGWEDPSYNFNYIAHSLDTLGFEWSEPYDPVIAYGVEEPGLPFRTTIDRTLMPKLDIDPVTGYLYMMPFYRINAGERYKTGVSRSTDNGETWSHYVDLGSRIGRLTEEVSWGTMAIGDNQIMHITYSKNNNDMMYIRANLAGLASIDDIVFTTSGGTTGADEPISFVPSGVVFQGTIVLDRNGDPHVIFSGDGGEDTFGDKTPYHIYYKESVGAWGPIPPQRLMADLENIWGMPEMVFDADNRGYYFFCDNSITEMIFGTWEPPADAGSATDFGTLNATGSVYDSDGASAIGLTTEHFPNVEVTADDYLYLANADVDDANDIVYLVANTNGYNSGNGGDIVILSLLDATTYAGQEPAAMDWSLFRWVTEDGIGLGDVGPDIVYDPSSTKLDVFWSGAGPSTNLAQFFPADIPKSAVDAQALTVAFNNTTSPASFEDGTVTIGSILDIIGVVKNNGTGSLGPIPVTATVTDESGTVLFTNDYTAPPLGSGQSSAEINFGSFVVPEPGRQDISLTLTLNYTGDEAGYNDEVGTSFFAYPNPDASAFTESFNDTNYINLPLYFGGGTEDGNLFVNDGDWYPTTPYEIGGWTVIDSSYEGFLDASEVLDLRNDYSSSWIMDDGNPYIRHMVGIRGDTAFGDISLPAGYTDSSYAQPQNETLLSPVYDLTGATADSLIFEFEDGLDGTDGEFNFPIHAYIDYSTDGGTTWNAVWHRDDLEGEGTNIGGTDGYHEINLTSELTGATSVQFRFWWRNMNNDGSYATWSVDNVALTYRGDVITGIDRNITASGYSLSKNYPNPFNPVTNIGFTLPQASDVRIAVYNLLGEEVTMLVDGHMPAGYHRVVFDGNGFASGVYFYRMQANGEIITNKMLLLK